MLPIVAVPAQRRSPSHVYQTKTPQVAKEPLQSSSNGYAPPTQVPIVAPVYAPIVTTKPNPEKKAVAPAKLDAQSRWTPPLEKSVTKEPESSSNATTRLKPPTHPKSPVNARDHGPYVKPSVYAPSNSYLPMESSVPKVFVSPRVITPPTKPTVPFFERQKGGGFPYQQNKSRLPPEVTACIEAYDCAHAVRYINSYVVMLHQ